MKKAPALRFKGFTNDWEERKLSDIADRFDNLRVPITASDRKPGDTPYYGANGIQDYVEGFTHNGEFILVAEDGANDLKNYPVQYVNGKVWVNNHAHVLQGKKTITDNKFLMNAIKNFNIEPFLVGGGRAKLNADVMMKLNILLPTFVEQEKIGSLFSLLDKTIALHQRKLESFQFTYHEIIRRLFLKKAKWQLTKLSDLVTILDKNRKPVKKEDRLLGDTPYYGANGIQDYISGFTHKGEFILIAEDGANSLTEYPIYFVKGQIWVNNHAHVLKVNRDVSPLFLALALKQINYSKYTVGSSRNKLNLKDLENIAIFIPDNNEQQKIGQFYSNYLNYLRINKKRIQYMKQFKQFLLQNMFI